MHVDDYMKQDPGKLLPHEQVALMEANQKEKVAEPGLRMPSHVISAGVPPPWRTARATAAGQPVELSREPLCVREDRAPKLTLNM